MPELIELISNELNIENTIISEELGRSYKKFKLIKIPKKSGGSRNLMLASTELKLIQSWVSINILSNLPISSISTAFHPGSSIIKNASMHKDSLFSVRVDLSNFFPSINSSDLISLFENPNIPCKEFSSCSDFEYLIKRACFNERDELPIGYMTSPAISNAVMLGIDSLLLNTLKSDLATFGNSVLTRYADDFVFSSDKRGSCKYFVDLIRATLESTPSPSLKINEKKTRFMSRKGGSTIITGLRINNECEVGIHANYRDHVRLLLKLYSRGQLKNEDIDSLRGHIAFIRSADPGFFTKISFKHYEEIDILRGKSSSDIKSI